jgi:indole-3-glycerol phosphate synthase
MDKLTEIMAWKCREIAPRVRDVSDDELAALAAPTGGRPSFRAALDVSDRLAVIAEMKRRSPSAGAIAESVSAVEQAGSYARAGTAAISVLTDEKYFGGTLDDLRAVTTALRQDRLRVPCLRKDFMVHPVQVVEAAQAGASAILIIVRALGDEEIRELFAAATLAGLDALFEVHDEVEVERALQAGARIIGVNNRDLAVFKTDLALSERLIPLIPRDVISISESGIFTPDDAARARAAGARAILVGEALMRAREPATLIAAFQRA